MGSLLCRLILVGKRSPVIKLFKLLQIPKVEFRTQISVAWGVGIMGAVGPKVEKTPMSSRLTPLGFGARM